MGSFDTIVIYCPNCGEKHTFQSKAGGCHLYTYTMDDCSPEILYDIKKDVDGTECSCGKILMMYVKTIGYII